MKAFEIAINGRRLATVGTGGPLFSNVFSVAEPTPPPGDPEPFVFVGGIDPRSGDFVSWNLPQFDLGDEILIRVVETDRVDPPDESYAVAPAESGEARGRVES
jgi:hypothetical protein